MPCNCELISDSRCCTQQCFSSWPQPLNNRRTGANHAAEIPFVFATWPDFRLTAADQQMTRTLPGCWVAFAKAGKPVCPDAPQWPAFSVGSDMWMQFGERVAPQPVSERPILNFLRKPAGKITSLDTFQLPGLVADAMKAIDHLGVDAELQLVFNLLRINYTITQ
jgi:hypothetical protein